MPIKWSEVEFSPEFEVQNANGLFADRVTLITI